jgi:hypothetical protein
VWQAPMINTPAFRKHSLSFTRKLIYSHLYEPFYKAIMRAFFFILFISWVITLIMPWWVLFLPELFISSWLMPCGSTSSAGISSSYGPTAPAMPTMSDRPNLLGFPRECYDFRCCTTHPRPAAGLAGRSSSSGTSRSSGSGSRNLERGPRRPSAP